ncbi:MAG: hypothetical protein K1X55_15235 [Chitinophagales bacterium]|nr:hypothetical protein [Chitinophagales bacterium]
MKALVFLICLSTFYSVTGQEVHKKPDDGLFHYFYNYVYTNKDSLIASISEDSVNLAEGYTITKKGMNYDTVEWRLLASDRLIQKGTFNRDGIPEGNFLFYEYYAKSNMELVSESAYKNGKKNGITKIEGFDSSFIFIHYRNGLKEGLAYSTVRDGIRWISHYKEGELDGFSAYYDRDGIPIEYMIYENGVPKDGVYARYYAIKRIWYTLKCEDGVCKIIEPEGLIIEKY